MLAAIIVTETLICLKFGWETIILVPPTDVMIFWFIVSVLWLVYTIWMFFPPIVRSWKEGNSHPTTKTKVK